MQLILSSAACPDGSLADLQRGARRRNLEGLEVVVGAGHAHGIEASCEVDPADGSVGRPEQDGVPVQWLLVEGDVSASEALYWGQRAHLLRTGLILSETVPDSPAGVPVALRHPTDPAAAQRARAWAELHDAYTCWEVDVAQVSEGGIDEVLEGTASHLAHVRLRGAGPESQSDTCGGVSTGDVLKALALQEYDGTVALAPSPDGRRAAWRSWLFEERGWGCNTAVKKKASK